MSEFAVGAGRPAARVLPVLLLAASVAGFSTGPAAADEDNSVGLSDTTYILNLDQLQPSYPGEGAATGEPGFTAISTPTGVYLPDTTAYFDLQGSNDRVTYLTPRVQGVQVSWTSDSGEAEPGSRRGNKDKARTTLARPTSVGASYAKGQDDFEFSFGGDYGRTPKSVPGAVKLVDDEKLLRLGAHARISQFTLGGAFGSDADPRDLGQTLSWDAFGRYDFGALSVGVVYNYMMQDDGSSEEAEGVIPGTVQGGVSYFFTPRMAVSTNLAYGSYIEKTGSDEAGVAGVLGFSLDF